MPVRLVGGQEEREEEEEEDQDGEEEEEEEEEEDKRIGVVAEEPADKATEKERRELNKKQHAMIFW